MPILTVDGADVEVVTRNGEAILAALSRHGYAHTFGCRRGGCGVCKVELVRGEVDYPALVSSEVLSDIDQRSGTCLSCRAVPVTDTVIRLLADDKLRCVAPFLAAAARKSTIERGK
jgi:ferredoxin